MKKKALVLFLSAISLLLVATAVLDAANSYFGKRPPEIICKEWLNSQPLSLRALRGRVALIDFWSPG